MQNWMMSKTILRPKMMRMIRANVDRTGVTSPVMVIFRKIPKI